MTLPSPIAIINRARVSGQCIPSLLPSESETTNDDLFLALVSKLVDDGLSLRNNVATANDFQSAIKMVQNNGVSDITDAFLRRKALIQRRSILLVLIGSTPNDNVALATILKNGLLVAVKSWLDDILNNKIGGVDLLLHLLSSITMLPVTKEMVTSSKLGKQVAAVEKHNICTGGLNETAIKDRVTKVKEEWSASVRRLKQKDKSTSNSLKRVINDDRASTSSKRTRTKEPAKKSSLSSLISQVSSSRSAAVIAKKTAPEREVRVRENITSKESGQFDDASRIEPKQSTAVKVKKGRHIKWADDQGVPLTISREVKKFTAPEPQELHSSTDASRSDSKKRDRLREKELLQNARKSKLVDKDDSLDTMAMMFSSGWKKPALLPDTEHQPVQVNSNEAAAQARRMAGVLPLSFLSEDDVPSDPSPLTEVEQAMDFTAQSSAVPQPIPFFVPQHEPAPLPLPAHAPPPMPIAIPGPPALPPTVATAEIVRSMGLPDFLVGQNIQALQTLTSSPGLLNAFVVNGNYDQNRVLNLLQTITQNNMPNMTSVVPPPPIPPAPSVIPQTLSSYNAYGPPTTQAPSPYQRLPQASSYKPPTTNAGGYRGDQNNTDGNLHLSGFGPTTTPDDIIALFSPYVKVEEVVPKNGFMFVNTSDPDGAQRAREALNGVMIGGSPLRINVALRRNKNATQGLAGAGEPSPSTTRPGKSSTAAAPLPRNALGQVDYEAVRDDRGNPATKNLFVAGYGQGTTEQQLRDFFSQQTQITGVVMKGSFAFVNTTEKNAAVLARQALIGAAVNGGSLRINFAKESGRLGTSFDNGYTSTKRNPISQQSNYYGRSY